MAEVDWGSFRIPRVTSSGPADSSRGYLGEVVIPSKSQNIVPADFLTLHMVELILVIQAGERLNFVVDFSEHDEETTGVLLVIWAAFG